ncbi:VanZ family protein [Streptococcaceae bacterium ESL0687]|nr:VanZ family protein [Streptococcaceae bacterium ESL0687]
MKVYLKYILALALSFGLSYFLVQHLAYPTLAEYPRLARIMARFTYTKEVLILMTTLLVWLLYIQWELKKIFVIYTYMAATIYVFLLFVVLFTKAEHYHALSLDPFDFLRDMSVKDLREALLNLIYFIPLGVIYGFQAGKKEFVFISLLTLLGVETIQYLFYLGTFGISDIMLNFIGCSIGYFSFIKNKGKFTIV